MTSQRKKGEEKGQAKESAKRGRPSLYSEEIATTICQRLALGESSRVICEDEGMPSRITLLNWLNTKPEFCAIYARAREAQADHLDEEIQIEALAATPETVNVARLRIETMKWRAARMAPKKYGDKLELDNKHSGQIAMTITQEDAGIL